MKYGSGVLVWLCATPALASSGYWAMDNDVVVKTDGDYTNGLFLGHISAPGSELPAPLKPFARRIPDHQVYWHGELSQKMWTPSDLDPEDQSSLERPYAGTLLATVGLGQESENRADHYGVSLGVIGPASGAEAVQRQVHKWLGNTAPDGWDQQIENTPLMQLSWLQSRRVYQVDWDSTGWDLLLHPRIQGGNLQSEAAMGFSMGWGNDLGALRGRHWSQGPVAGSGRAGWTLYAGSEVRYRLNDITLQGPRPDDAPDVSLAHWQAGWAVGLRGHYRGFGASFSVQGDSAAYRDASRDWTSYGRLAFYWNY